ncbi:MAG: glycosyltransferase family 4 protein [Planctomycetes bacterium]|nr:glycosyltransferase family 4 protein [Planctomycetota bacterium]
MNEPAPPPRVAVVLAVPTPYASPFLGKVARSGRVRLKVFYCAAREAGRDWGALDADGVDSEVLAGRGLVVRAANLTTMHLNPGATSRLAAFRPDVVVIGGYYLQGMQAAIAWCVCRRLPWILATESHGLAPRPAWARMLRRLVVGFLVRRATALQVTGILAREDLLGLGAQPADIFRFPNTPDVRRLAERARELAPRRAALRAELGLGHGPLALFVGRLVAVKGVASLLGAFSAVLGRLPDARLALVGDGPLRAELESRAERACGGRVRFFGSVAPAELARFYAAADLLVLPSLEEPWGIVVNEAMAFGLPVLASDRVGAAHDLVLPGETGYRVPAGSDREWADALVRLLSDPALRARLGARAQTVIAGWTQEAFVPAFEAAIFHALGKARKNGTANYANFANSSR